jgi:hypothetical protein
LRREDVPPALRYTALGAAQAVLLAAALLAGSGADGARFGTATPLTTPLLIGVPVAEYLVLRHRIRLEQALDVSTDRAAFRRQMLRAVVRTLGLLALGVAPGLAVATRWAATDSVSGLQLACGVLLAGHSVLTLLFMAHGRLRVAGLLAGVPAALVVSVTVAIAALGMPVPRLAGALTLAVIVLATAVAFGALAALCLLPEGARP